MRACETLFRMKIPLQRRLQLTHIVRQLRAIARLRPPLADVETKLSNFFNQKLRKNILPFM